MNDIIVEAHTVQGTRHLIVIPLVYVLNNWQPLQCKKKAIEFLLSFKQS